MTGNSEKLQELANFIRETLPQTKSIQNLQLNPQAQVVTFNWQGRSFLVNAAMQVFEVKGKNLFITAASSLLHSVISRKSHHERVLESALDVLRHAEDLMRARPDATAGLELLSTARGNIAKLITKSTGKLA